MSCPEIELINKIGQIKKDKIMREAKDNYVIFLQGQQIFRLTDVTTITNGGDIVMFYTEQNGEETIQGVFNSKSILGYAREVIGKVAIYEGNEKQMELAQYVFHPKVNNETVDYIISLLKKSVEQPAAAAVIEDTEDVQ